MNTKIKNIVKIAALAMAGVSACTALGFGVKAIVDYTKEDLKTISPTFEVGSLGTDGKFVDDETMLYTKEAFECYGLQIKPEFDSEVNYQIFYYDILDNFISSTSMMSDGFSGEAPLNGAYARMVIEPRNDEDGKISFTEKISYPKNLTVKVKKEQDIDKRFLDFNGKLMQVVYDTNNLVFTNNLSLSPTTITWEPVATYCSTAVTVLKVQGGSTFAYDFSSFGETHSHSFCRIFEFEGLPLENNLNKISCNSQPKYSFVLDKNTNYIIICANTDASGECWTENDLLSMPLLISVNKTK